MFFSGIDGANSFKIKALVFAGLATTKTCKRKETKWQFVNIPFQLEFINYKNGIHVNMLYKKPTIMAICKYTCYTID